MNFSKEVARFLATTRAKKEALEKLMISERTDIDSTAIRFEQLLAILRETIDPSLSILDTFQAAVSPNTVHELLAKSLMTSGASVFTTNFDSLVEASYESASRKSQSKFEPLAIACFETKQPGLKNCSFEEQCVHRKGILYKLHGTLSFTRSVQDQLSSSTTSRPRKSIGATLDRLGSETGHLRLEIYKHKALIKRCRKKTIVVVGYSGLDDFDVVPSFAQALKNAKRIIWVSHSNSRSKVLNEPSSAIPDLISRSAEESGIPIFEIEGKTHLVLGKLYQSEWGRKHLKINAAIPVSTSQLRARNAEKSFVLGQIFSQVSDYQNAISSYRHAARLYFRYGQREEAARAVEFESGCLLQTGETRRALYKIDQAISIYATNKSWTRLAVARNDKAEILNRMGDFSNALRLSKMAIATLKRVPDSPAYISALYFRAELKHIRGQVESALSLTTDAIEVSQEARLRRKEAQGHMLLSRFQRELGESASALESVLRAQKLYRLLGHPSPLASALIGEGNIHLQCGNLREAKAAYKSAKETATEIQRLSAVATATANLGIVYKRAGDHEGSLDLFEKALKLEKAIKRKDGYVRNVENIAIYHIEKGNYGKAKEMLDECVAIHRVSSNLEKLALSLGNLATNHLRQGLLQEARKSANEALKINRRLRRPLGISGNLQTRAEIELKEGKMKTAWKTAVDAIQIAANGQFLGVVEDCADSLGRVMKEVGGSARDEQHLRVAIAELRSTGDVKRFGAIGSRIF